MWQYEGPLDATRMSQEELSKEELDDRVRSITSIKAAEPCQLDGPVSPFSSNNPLLEVSLFALIFEFCHLFLLVSMPVLNISFSAYV